MPVSNDANLVSSLLDSMEKEHGRPRWVPRFAPMDELVSCILSQHSADVRTFPTFTRLLESFSGWEEMAAAPLQVLATIIQPAGLANQKAKSILGCLREIHARFGDYTLDPLYEMDTSEAYDWLVSLPGVGHKTASIVLCFAFGRGTIPVDTHVYRVSWRLGLIEEGIGEPKAALLLQSLVPPEWAFRFHVDLIQHGRTICRAPLPDCPRCPVSDRCRWFLSGGPAIRKVEMVARRRELRGGP